MEKLHTTINFNGKLSAKSDLTILYIYQKIQQRREAVAISSRRNAKAPQFSSFLLFSMHENPFKLNVLCVKRPNNSSSPYASFQCRSSDTSKSGSDAIY